MIWLKDKRAIQLNRARGARQVGTPPPILVPLRVPNLGAGGAQAAFVRAICKEWRLINVNPDYR